MNNSPETPLMATLQNADLELVSLPAGLCDLADQIIKICDSNYLAGIDDYEQVELFLAIAAPRFIECRRLDSSIPTVMHNTEILLLLTMNLKLSLMSRPSHKNAS